MWETSGSEGFHRSGFTLCENEAKDQQQTDVDTEEESGSWTASDWPCAWKEDKRRERDQRKHAGGGRERGMAA